jgi:molybdopterin synthase catalytic subunit
MLHAKIIDASKEKIDILKAEKFLSSSNFGAIIYFVGTVRDINENKKVIGITYDSRDTMVIKSFEEIYKESESKLKIKDKAVFIEHVKGYLDVKEKSIIIGVGCRHRDEAYNLSRFIIEEIKKRTPVWKKEHYTNEESEWLKGVSIQL